METSNASTVEVKMDLFGRSVLTVNPPDVLDAKSVGEILNKVMPKHKKNSEDIAYLDAFRRGNQPILYRKKTIRPEIKNIVVENRAAEVVEFKVGYEFAKPPIYTNVGENESAPIGMLNTYERLDNRDSKIIELARNFFTYGTAYSICLPNLNPTIDEAPYYTDILDSGSTFVVYSSEVGKKPLLAGKYVKRKAINKKTNKEEDVTVYGVYTDTHFYTWQMPEDKDDFVKEKPVNTESNTVNMIPIVEYSLNDSRLGYVELCMHLFNAINTVGSNRLDGIEQFIQSLLVFINCELPTDEDGKKHIPKSGEAIDIKGNGALTPDVKYLIAQLDQSQAQVTKEDLLNAMYEISGVPSRADRRSGGDTGQAVVLRDGWGAAESRAKSTEKPFEKADKESLKIKLHICRNIGEYAKEIEGLTLRDIGLSFQRTRSDNMQVKAQTLQMLNDSGVHPELTYEVSELFNDPVAAFKKSLAWQKSGDAHWVARNQRMARKLPDKDDKAQTKGEDETAKEIVVEE